MSCPSSHLLSDDAMNNKKLDVEEINALLESFSELRVTADNVQQNRIFKSVLIFINIYVLLFITTFILLQQNIIAAFNEELLADYFDVFYGRSYANMWFLASLNITVYFNLGVRILLSGYLIWSLNSAIDNLVLFSGSFDASQAPYLFVYIATSPLLIFALIAALFLHKSYLK